MGADFLWAGVLYGGPRVAQEPDPAEAAGHLAVGAPALVLALGPVPALVRVVAGLQERAQHLQVCMEGLRRECPLGVVCEWRR